MNDGTSTTSYDDVLTSILKAQPPDQPKREMLMALMQGLRAESGMNVVECMKVVQDFGERHNLIDRRRDPRVRLARRGFAILIVVLNLVLAATFVVPGNVSVRSLHAMRLDIVLFEIIVVAVFGILLASAAKRIPPIS